MKKTAPNNPLRALAKACGVQLSYRDMDGRIKCPSSSMLLSALRSLGIPVQTAADCSAALERVQKQKSRRVMEPILVAWGGRLSTIRVRLFNPLPDILNAKLELESAETLEFQWAGLTQVAIKTNTANKSAFQDLALPFGNKLPFGYHRLTLVAGKITAKALIISAPHKAPELTPPNRRWGLLCPLYALHSGFSWGAGDFSDFFKLAQLSAAKGGGIVATLPLLPAFYREHFNPSPYSPVSRLFWNEFFIDVAAIPELAQCSEAADLITSKEYQDEISEQLRQPLVDYAAQMELKRRILEILAESFFQKPQSSPRRRALEKYLTEKPELKNYARFRAVSERLQCSWTEWSERLLGGFIDASDYDLLLERYYLYTQFIAHEQIAMMTKNARDIGQSLYLDLPLGANSDGYDVWKNQRIFALGASVGAPPDPAFPNGQDWGFPPPHPERLRESGYRYFIQVIRHHLQFAGMLRLDHIMGLHRLYWIPAGSPADQGVYVRYEAEEMYAILCLEAHKAQAMIVGEDLGLVPETVRWSMRRHNIYRSYVAQYEMLSGNDNCLDTIPVHAVAAINTHDMHPFAAFWRSTDIGERETCGVLSPERAVTEEIRRRAGKEALTGCLRRRNLVSGQTLSAMDVYRAICRVIAASDAEVMLLSIDDLTGATQAQNIPGTCLEHPNWRRRALQSLEQLEKDPEIDAFLKRIDNKRRGIFQDSQ